MKTAGKGFATYSASHKVTGMSVRFATLLLGALCLVTLPSAHGLPLTGNPVDDADAGKARTPARAVRLSSAEGGVQVVQDGQVIADPALVNQPLFEGSQIITATDGRAEIQLEDGSLVRISPNTTVTFSVLQQEGTGTRTEIVLNGGLAYFELQPSNAEHSLRVNYGTASFSASSFSVVRLEQDTPPGTLAVFSGNVHLEQGDAIQLDIHGGESVALNATDPSQYNLSETIAPDSWDAWNSDRDQVLSGEAADRTSASAAMGNYGAEGLSDLDANGNWYNVPGTGYIWSPYDAQAQGAAWDPYGYGHWVYYPRLGFIWVSGYGWGYAPFQCGLWNFYDGLGWGWVPGGGCNPWGGFGAEFYGSGWYNIGIVPRGYRPPRRPSPIRPRTGPNTNHPFHKPPVAAVLVDRRPAETIGLPHAGRTAEPVVIAGQTVQPLRPLAARQAYTRSPSDSAGRPGVAMPGFTTGAHPVYSGSGAVAGRPGTPASGARPAAPVSRPAPARSAPAASHASSSGGGGGGGGHAASSSGGGGGSTHK